MNFKIKLDLHIFMSFILKVAGIACLLCALDEVGIYSILPVIAGVSLFTLGDRLYVYYKD